MSPRSQKNLTILLKVLVVIIPALTSSFATYMQTRGEAEKGYKVLAQNVVELQREVEELHITVGALQAHGVQLEAKVMSHTGRLISLMNDLKVADDSDGDGIADGTYDAGVPEVMLAPLGAPPPHTYKARPPPASLRGAIEMAE